MEQQLAKADKQLLVKMVKLAQKRGMKGSQGGWKDFLNVYDRKFGACLSDPSRRSNEVLVAFLKSFTDENDSKFLAKIFQCYSNRDMVEQMKQESPDKESHEQRLVRLTLEHPQYPLDYSFPSYDEDWVVTKLPKKSKLMRSTAMLAVDCEMVLCEDGTEALVKVCIVDRDLKVKLNEFVNPGKAVTDYRSYITDVTSADLEGVTCSLADVQKSLKKLLSHGTILVGHSLNSDLRALKLDHVRIIDTAYIFKYSNEPMRIPSLNNLCKSVLGCEVRKEGAPHNCVDDACAAMKLVLTLIERGSSSDIVYIQEDVHYSEMAKLFLHRIPTKMSSEELHRAIPGEFALETKPPKNANGDKYSAFAIFGSPDMANQTFESLEGALEMDSFGRPHKLISLNLGNGGTARIFVRKMVNDATQSHILSKKRASAEALNKDELKKQKVQHRVENQCKDHLEEIARLKQEVSQKDLLLANQDQGCSKEIEELKKELTEKNLEISVLHKMVKQLKEKLEKNQKRGS